MKIYIDSDFKCHTIDDGNMTTVKTNFFDGKCGTFIGGYCFVPTGETWTRSDDAAYHDEMIATWKSSNKLNNTQREYKKQSLIEYNETFSCLIG